MSTSNPASRLRHVVGDDDVDALTDALGPRTLDDAWVSAAKPTSSGRFVPARRRHATRRPGCPASARSCTFSAPVIVRDLLRRRPRRPCSWRLLRPSPARRPAAAAVHHRSCISRGARARARLMPPAGGVSAVGPVMRVTAAPRAVSSAASGVAHLPAGPVADEADGIQILVGRARRDDHAPPGAALAAQTARARPRRRSSPARRAGPCQSSRTPGSPRRARRTSRRAPRASARFCCTAGCASMFVFMAGASSTGAVVARYSEDRKSSAIPCANFPMTLAVAGATTRSAMSEAIEMCSMSAFAPGFHWLVITRRRVMASKVTGADEAPAPRASSRPDHVVPALLQQTRELDGLVGADSAGHSEGDERHGLLNVSMIRRSRRFPSARKRCPFRLDHETSAAARRPPPARR